MPGMKASDAVELSELWLKAAPGYEIDIHSHPRQGATAKVDAHALLRLLRGEK